MSDTVGSFPGEQMAVHLGHRAAPSTIETDDLFEDRRIALKKQKREYRDEKKRVTQELLTTLHDPTIVVMADWLKVRGTLKKWNRYFCVIKPGLMLIYKSNKIEKHGYWVGTVLLNTCELIERPSKKDGFCFKLFHPMDQSIWATRGPLGESHGAVTLQPLPSTHLICRAPSEQAGGCWMDALHLTLRCSGLLMRTMRKLQDPTMKEDLSTDFVTTKVSDSENYINASESRPQLNEQEAEKHFCGLDDDNERAATDSEGSMDFEEESNYVPCDAEQLGMNLDCVQTEDLADENKSLVWSLLKQVRPGMDLSKVTLPTFILEPRSFLEKLADFYHHADILAETVMKDDPLERMKSVVKFYLSGFYKKPKGLKKPYNPILGEVYRCKFEHPDGTASYYIAEQVSHHPPISALYLTNRKAGFNISGTILAKSKYYGNSLSAMMVGDVRITLLPRNETYIATLPYANCKGIMIGTLSMEYGGQVTIKCNRTDYMCSLEFKLKPFIGGSINAVAGSIKYGKETVAQIEGTWDGDIYLIEKGMKTILWAPTSNVIKRRLKRYEIPLEEQKEFESKRLWLKVAEAIVRDDQNAATEEKSKLEEEQRLRAKSGIHHKPRYFRQEPLTKNCVYINAEYQAWDENDDIRQIENNFIIKTITKHGARERSISPISSTSVPAEASDDSGSLIARRHRLKKNHLTEIDVDRLQQIQDTLDRSLDYMRHLQASIDGKRDNGITYYQALIMVVLFAVFQSVVLPMIVGSRFTG